MIGGERKRAACWAAATAAEFYKADGNAMAGGWEFRRLVPGSGRQIDSARGPESKPCSGAMGMGSRGNSTMKAVAAGYYRGPCSERPSIK